MWQSLAVQIESLTTVDRESNGIKGSIGRKNQLKFFEKKDCILHLNYQQKEFIMFRKIFCATVFIMMVSLSVHAGFGSLKDKLKQATGNTTNAPTTTLGTTGSSGGTWGHSPLDQKITEAQNVVSSAGAKTYGDIRKALTARYGKPGYRYAGADPEWLVKADLNNCVNVSISIERTESYTDATKDQAFADVSTAKTTCDHPVISKYAPVVN